ncbi:hypothetical protein GCK72_025067 [Caenorhabditis remanei]|uniref:Protein kinase domain-containing protein n=1 Tax=Caenorhabditis remanei TaxID=31234 RepID=A0A6A5G0W8_CAERE|nr:hypothetical protein GCK72_025067 [Caenorhabditis remanei]KAF1748600.1 hypothetical protein GCK72_025067 [Caenorhabditis remanei]
MTQNSSNQSMNGISPDNIDPQHMSFNTEEFNFNDARLSVVHSFRLLKEINNGSFGVVYFAENYWNKEQVAIKVMRKKEVNRTPYLRHRANEERRIHSQLCYSPHIIRLRICFTTTSRYCMMMDLASQQTLFDVTTGGNVLGTNVAKHWLAEICAGLQYLQESNIAHRDIKRENMLLSTTGHMKISDFGFAKSEMTATQRTRTVCGTSACMSPEVFKGEGYTRATDVWSFGIIVVELMSGSSVFRGMGRDKIKATLKSLEDCATQLQLPPLPEDACNLARKMLCFEISRISLEEIEKHHFFSCIQFDKLLSKSIDVSENDTVWSKSDCTEPVVMVDDGDENPFEGFDLHLD